MRVAGLRIRFVETDLIEQWLLASMNAEQDTTLLVADFWGTAYHLREANEAGV